MWSGRREPYEGVHYRLGRTLNVPQPLHRPYLIMIGGVGEQRARCP